MIQYTYCKIRSFIKCASIQCFSFPVRTTAIIHAKYLNENLNETPKGDRASSNTTKNCKPGEGFVKLCSVKKACVGEGGECERAG